jgi:hypothetical protein
MVEAKVESRTRVRPLLVAVKCQPSFRFCRGPYISTAVRPNASASHEVWRCLGASRANECVFFKVEI